MLTAPVLTSFDFHHQTGHSLVATFQDRVDNLTDPLENTDLTLQKVPLDTNVPASSISLSNPSLPGTVGTFTFTGQTGSSGATILPDGNYRAVLARQTVADGTDTMATDGIEDFFVFAGDPNHDTTVDLDDFNIVAINFNTTGRTFAEGNLDYDPAGLVGLDDFNIMAPRFGTDVPPPPTAPNVIEVGANTDFSFSLLWLDPIVSPAQEQGWRVQDSFTGQSNDWIIVDPDLPANSMTWTTDAFGDGTRVWFRTRAFGNGQDTAYTPKRYAITHLPLPTTTSVTAISSTQIKVDFTDNSQNEDYFQVYRSLTPVGGFQPVGSPILSGSPTTFIDSGLSPNTQYYYYVRARNAVIDSSPPPAGQGATTQPATAFMDLDVFEDVNSDFIHDNSAAAEQLENTQPTALPFLEDDGDYVEMALTVSGTAPTATVTFTYSQSQLQLLKDIMGLTAINPGEPVMVNWGQSPISCTLRSRNR